MEDTKIVIQKTLYTLLFCVVLPFILMMWANATEDIVQLQVPQCKGFDFVLIFLGFTFICSSMFSLFYKGKGLPMNAFPPQKYVQSGLYYFFHHPIYVGAILLSFGLAMRFNSASGFWFISPVLILLITAYVIGFENEVIAKAFPGKSHKTFFDFPESNHEKVSLKNRLLLYVWIYLPWFLIYESFIFLGVPNDAIPTNLALDKVIPYIDFSVIFYVLLYPLALIIPFVIKNNVSLNEFIFDLITGMVMIFLCYLAFPFVAENQMIEVNNVFSELIILGRKTDGITAALPSFHVFWALIFYKYFSQRFKKFRVGFLLLSILIILSCLTTKNHTVADVLAGILVYLIVLKRVQIYKSFIQFCEKISNSWKEWRFGKVRIINHGFYAALGGISGFIIMGYFLPNHLYIIYIIGISGFVGAGLWAQFIEGSPMLLRPYGYYGSVMGVAIALLLTSLITEISLWYLLGIATVAASSIQFFGRFRCLVQGCCHGKPTKKVIGIKFTHPKSRVNKIAGWSGKNLYPTQVYSIISNFVTFFLLFRLVSLEMPATFIIGMYLIFNGSFRFIEESLRGEPQTPYFMGMRVYQWLALLSIVSGIIISCVSSEPLVARNLNITLIVNSLIYGCIILFAYGIDFPNSNVRFSRLTQ